MKTLISTNPAKGFSVVGEVQASSKEEIEEKVKLAREAYEKWKFTDIDQRIKLLKKVYEIFNKHTKEISELETAEMGKPIQYSQSEMESGLEYFKWYLDNASMILAPEITHEDKATKHTVYREPIGVAAVICPWNYPFDIFIWQVMPNLIAGNTVVCKMSEECPLLGQLYEKLINEAGLPEGVFNEIYGDGEEGQYLVEQNIDLIHFTGSSKVGKLLYKNAAEKFIRVVLELGGSAPGIVCEDADIKKVVESIYFNRFQNCGQACDGQKRLIVHESKFDEVIDGLKNMIKSKKIGMPELEDTDLGPLVTEKQLKLVEEQVEDAKKQGTEVVIGGERYDKLDGAFYEQTLLTNIKPTMRVWKEEVFGPVLPIVTYKTEDEAIKLANDTNYGLGGYVYTEDSEKALNISRKIQSGGIVMNNTDYWVACNPFGGYKESGMGREHGKYGFEDVTQIKVITLEK